MQTIVIGYVTNKCLSIFPIIIFFVFESVETPHNPQNGSKNNNLTIYIWAIEEKTFNQVVYITFKSALSMVLIF